MRQKLNGKLECEECQTIYLSIPHIDAGDGPVFCSSCGGYMGRWRDIESEFIAEGGLNGVFELRDGEIIRVEWDRTTPKLGS
jgi:hypothetical protein